MNKKRRYYSLGIITGLILSAGVQVFATECVDTVTSYLRNEFKIIYNNEIQNMPEEYNILVYEDRSYLPIRYISDLLGCDIDWNDTEKTILITQNDGTKDNTDNEKPGDSGNTGAVYEGYSELPQHSVSENYIVDVNKYMKRSEGNRIYVNIENRGENSIYLKPAATVLTVDGIPYDYNKDISIPDRDDTWYRSVAGENESIQGYIILPRECKDAQYVHLELTIVENVQNGTISHTEKFDIDVRK